MNIFILEYITNATCNRVVKEIIKNRPEPEEPIVVYINSTGGEEEADYAIYEALRMSGRKIITHAVNEVCSSAITVYLAGDERYATNYSRFMIHRPFEAVQSESEYIADTYRHHAKGLDAMADSYFRLICKRSELTQERLKNFIKSSYENNWFFDTKTAKKWGVVHEIGFPILENGVLV